MQDTNAALRTIMQEQGLDVADIARELDVAEARVLSWAMDAGAERMPESELRLLQYALMTDNKRYHLF